MCVPEVRTRFQRVRFQHKSVHLHAARNSFVSSAKIVSIHHGIRYKTHSSLAVNAFLCIQHYTTLHVCYARYTYAIHVDYRDGCVVWPTRLVRQGYELLIFLAAKV